MNRRQAIWGIALLGGSGLATAGGSVWLSRHSPLDLAYLTNHKKLVAALAETIIPATDSPGAIEAGVPAFILKMIIENTPLAEQNRFVQGLKEIDTYCVDTHKRAYVDCSRDIQHDVMLHFEAKGQSMSGLSGKLQQKITGESFFNLLKKYTCLGYYTSMMGATQDLAYEPIPGRFVGCVPLTANQKSWATK